MQQTEHDQRATAPLTRELAEVLAAHILMLRDEAIVEEPVARALLAALDAVRQDTRSAPSALWQLIATTDERIDAQSPPGARGAIGLGRGTTDVAATLLRLLLRDGVLALGDTLAATRDALLSLAEAHTITLMPASSHGQPAQPTTFAHYLGGVIAPLQRIGARLPAIFGEINQSPLGAGALAATSLAISRERAAVLLGFDVPVPNTYDAVVATDHVVQFADVIEAIATPLRRFGDEILIWLRTHPSSFRLADEWLMTDPALPQITAPVGLEAFVAEAMAVEQHARAVSDMAGRATYQPVTVLIEQLAAQSRSLLDEAFLLLADAAELFGSALQPNRAYLANRAGRTFTTASDLAIFLMIEEGLEPAAARDIAQLALSRAMGEGLEISGVTPDLIDAAALTVIGRELKVELETISRYLAPRRFLERREATGSPAPGQTRAYLEAARAQLTTDRAWLMQTRQRLARAREEREREVEALLAIRAE